MSSSIHRWFYTEDDGVFGRFARAAAAGDPVPVIGREDVRWPLVHREPVADLLMPCELILDESQRAIRFGETRTFRRLDRDQELRDVRFREEPETEDRRQRKRRAEHRETAQQRLARPDKRDAGRSRLPPSTSCEANCFTGARTSLVQRSIWSESAGPTSRTRIASIPTR